MRTAFYQGQALDHRVHWDDMDERSSIADKSYSELGKQFKTNGFVRCNAFVPSPILAAAVSAVQTTLEKPGADSKAWRDLTLGRSIQKLSRGHWIRKRIKALLNAEAVPETATYVRAVRRGGSLLHADAAREFGPSAPVLKVWIALSSITAEHGGLFILPDRSRPQGLQACTPARVKAIWNRIDNIKEMTLKSWLEAHGEKLLGFSCSPGDAIIFDGLTLHGSLDRTEDNSPRMSVDTGWQPIALAAAEFVGPTASDVDSYASFVGSPSSWAGRKGL